MKDPLFFAGLLSVKEKLTEQVYSLQIPNAEAKSLLKAWALKA